MAGKESLWPDFNLDFCGTQQRGFLETAAGNDRRAGERQDKERATEEPLKIRRKRLIGRQRDREHTY
jgi:hypothetical protein